MSWTVFISDSCRDWLDGLPVRDRDAVLENLVVLRAYGPGLGRPYVDHIKGSRHRNMKELRAKHHAHHYRILFAFDPERRAILLAGGDKVGKDERRFYQVLIAEADDIFDRHLANIRKRRTP